MCSWAGCSQEASLTDGVVGWPLAEATCRTGPQVFHQLIGEPSYSNGGIFFPNSSKKRSCKASYGLGFDWYNLTTASFC